MYIGLRCGKKEAWCKCVSCGGEMEAKKHKIGVLSRKIGTQLKNVKSAE